MARAWPPAPSDHRPILVAIGRGGDQRWGRHLRPSHRHRGGRRGRHRGREHDV